MCLCNPTPGYASGGNHGLEGYMHPSVHCNMFTVAKTWKKPKCPFIKEWIRKKWYMYTVEYYPAIKKNEVMPFATTWMYLEIVILSDKSKSDRINSDKEKYDIPYLLYVESKKK